MLVCGLGVLLDAVWLLTLGWAVVAAASVVFMLVWLSSLVICCRLLFDCLIDIVVGLLITGLGFGVGLVAFLGLCVDWLVFWVDRLVCFVGLLLVLDGFVWWF